MCKTQKVAVFITTTVTYAVVTNQGQLLRLRGRYSLFKIILGGMSIVLANKFITTHSLTLLSVSVII